MQIIADIMSTLKGSAYNSAIALASVILSFISEVIYVLSPNVPRYAVIFLMGLQLWLVYLLFINLMSMVRSSKSRTFRGGLAIAIVLIIIGSWYYGVKWHVDIQDKWFLQDGYKSYEAVVRRIEQVKTNLTDCSSVLKEVSGQFLVAGRTNADGSMTLMFFGRGGNPRACYFYYDGHDLPMNLMDANHPLVRLTNGWYR